MWALQLNPRTARNRGGEKGRGGREEERECACWSQVQGAHLHPSTGRLRQDCCKFEASLGKSKTKVLTGCFFLAYHSVPVPRLCPPPQCLHYWSQTHMVLSTEDNPNLVFLNFVLALENCGLTEHDSSPLVPMFRMLKQENTTGNVTWWRSAGPDTCRASSDYYLSLCSQGEAGFLS